MFGQNGYGAALNAARGLAECGAVGHHERVAAPFYLRLTRLATGEVRLVLAHRDRQPSYEEMSVFAQAAGGPAELQVTPTIWLVAAQDGTQTRLRALVAGWREY